MNEDRKASNDLTLALDAYERGQESAKLYRWLMRLALQAARSRKVRADTRMADVSAVIVKTMAIRELGRIAYYAMRIAQHVGEIDKKIDDPTISAIQKMAKLSIDMEEQSFAVLLNHDLGLASSIIDRMSHVRKLYEAAHSLVVEKQPQRTALALSLIIRDIRAIAGYAVAMADVAVLGIFGH